MADVNQDVKSNQPSRANGPAGRSIRSISPRACGGVKLACAFPILAAACRRCFCLLSVWRADRGQRALLRAMALDRIIGGRWNTRVSFALATSRRCLCTDKEADIRGIDPLRGSGHSRHEQAVPSE